MLKGIDIIDTDFDIINLDFDTMDIDFDTVEDFCIDNGYSVNWGTFTVPSTENGYRITLPKIILTKDPKYLDAAKLFRKYTELKAENRKLKLKIKELSQVMSK